MKTIGFLFGGIAALFLCAPAFSQTEGVPYVTQLRAENRNNLIRLVWTDSPGLRGPVYIFRSREPFDQYNPHSRIRPIEVPYGAQSYIDEAEEPGVLYYFISASRAAGDRNDIFLPFINTVSIEIPPFTNFVPAREGRGAPRSQAEEEGVYALEAAVRGDGALISFRKDPNTGNIILFRSVSPIRRSQDLYAAVIIETGVDSPFTDYPVPGIPYYYALVPEADFPGSPNLAIVPGRNATVQPVEIPAGSRVGLRNSPEIRAMPLPLISISAISPLGGSVSDTRDPVPLSPGAADASASYTAGEGFNRKIHKSPRAFSQDLTNTSGSGEDYALGAIVQGNFLFRNWAAVKEDLHRYLSLPRSAAAEARARFYLGQAQYYAGSFREALFEFLLVQDSYPDVAGEWIQASLAMLVK